VELQDLKALSYLHSGVQVMSTEAADSGPVVKITVNRVHTYITLGVISHNIKDLYDPWNRAEDLALRDLNMI